jgi:hypothetical protein
VIASDRLVGAVLFGDTADGPWYLELIRSGQRIDGLRDELVFGRALAEMPRSASCSKINRDEKMGSSAPERAARLPYPAPQHSAIPPQAFDSK